jgi:hypothetical protein
VPAVATVCGASSIPGDEVLKCLLGRKLRLWRDNDTVGNDHMQRIAARLAYLEQKEGSKNGN